MMQVTMALRYECLQYHIPILLKLCLFLAILEIRQ